MNRASITAKSAPLSVASVAFLTAGNICLVTNAARADVNMVCGLRDAGCYGHNGDTSIYVGPRGAYKIRGAIRDHWGQIGWENSVLGYPFSNEFCGLRDRGCATRFERAGGLMYWSPNTPPSYVKGLIGEKYASVRWESSIMGYPVTDEFCGLKNGGCGQHFQRENASIYWSSPTGAHIVQGRIKDHWASMDWERGLLGYPTTDEFSRDQMVYQNFQGGWLAWNGRDVYGAPWEGVARYGNVSDSEFQAARTRAQAERK